MITDKILIEKGYKVFNDTLYHADKLFQKKIRDNNGVIKYFIDIYKYEFDERIDYEVRLITEDENCSINVLLYAMRNKLTISEIEKKVERIWAMLGSNYYGEELD